MLKTKELKKIYIKHFVHVCLEYTHLSLYVQVQTENVIQDIRYFIFQIRAPGGHDPTFIISTYTIKKKVKYNNYFITINHVCHSSTSLIDTRRFSLSNVILLLTLLCIFFLWMKHIYFIVKVTVLNNVYYIIVITFFIATTECHALIR